MRIIRAYRTIQYFLLSGLLWGVSLVAHSQDSTDATTELLKLQAVFQNISYTSFDVNYYYEEDDSSGVLRDTLTGVYKVDKDRFYYMLDSVIQIQSDLYHVTVDKDNKIVYLERPYFSYTSVLQSNIMDSVFMENYVDQMLLADSSGYRKLTIQFRDEAPYTDYELLYDVNSFQPASIKFTIKKEAPEGSPPQYAKVRIIFSNYQTGTFDDSVFSTSWIFNRQNGVFVLNQETFSTYELANAYDEQ